MIELATIGPRSYVAEPDRGRRDWSEEPQARTCWILCTGKETMLPPLNGTEMHNYWRPLWRAYEHSDLHWNSNKITTLYGGGQQPRQVDHDQGACLSRIG
jgi:hypothetical protein